MKVDTKSKKVNKAWLNDHVNDPYVRLAQKEGFRSRAAYKLKEIDGIYRKLLGKDPVGGTALWGDLPAARMTMKAIVAAGTVTDAAGNVKLTHTAKL